MAKDDITKNNQIPQGFKPFQDGSVIRKLPCRILLARLKNLTDEITDPTYQQENPIGWARAYGVLINLLFTQDIKRKHVWYNLGKKRQALIEQIIQNVKEQVEKGSFDKR